jgi:penicillin-binding protein-related factor A (putative recombinase)
MSEKEIENSILYWLNYQIGCFAFKMKISGTWDKRGFYKKVGRFVAKGGADIVGVYNGKFFCFEVKTPAAFRKFFKAPGEHELRQQAFIHQVRSKCGFAEVVCSLEQVQEHVKRLL